MPDITGVNMYTVTLIFSISDISNAYKTFYKDMDLFFNTPASFEKHYLRLLTRNPFRDRSSIIVPQKQGSFSVTMAVFALEVPFWCIVTEKSGDSCGTIKRLFPVLRATRTMVSPSGDGNP